MGAYQYQVGRQLQIGRNSPRQSIFTGLWNIVRLSHLNKGLIGKES